MNYGVRERNALVLQKLWGKQEVSAVGTRNHRELYSNVSVRVPPRTLEALMHCALEHYDLNRSCSEDALTEYFPTSMMKLQVHNLNNVMLAKA